MSPYAAFVLFLAIGLADPTSLKDDPDMDDATTLLTTTIAETTITTTTTAETSTTTEATTTPPPTTTATTLPPTTTTTTLPPTTTTTTLPPTTTTKAPTTTTKAPTTTTAPTTMTSSPNTTTTNTTSTVPTTTTPAPTLPTPTTHLYQVKNHDNVSCLMVKFGLRFGYQGVKYEEMNFEFTNQTNVTGSCGEDSSELLIEADTVTFKLTFLNDTKKFSLHGLNATGKTSSGVAFTEANSNLTLWQASLGNSYMCNKEQNYTITKQLTIFTFELQVQPFGVKKESFSTAEDCMPAGESFIVPIAVGVALLALILIVLVAYFIGRKRNMASAEECFLDSDLSFLVPIAVGVALSFLIILVLISYLIGRRKSRTGYQSV